MRGGQEGRIPTIRRVIAAVLIWLSAALPIAAQSAGEPERWSELADTVFRNYGADDGLPISSVTAFAEDGDGFLWVGTQAGLARWDGYHFHVYHRDPADPAALQDDFIWCLHTDSRGRLWAGTNGGGVSRYDRAKDRFITFAIGASEKANAPVRSCAGDGAGGVWMGSDRGLYHLSPDGEVLDHLKHDSADPASLAGDVVGSLLRDHTGELWIGTNGGLVRQRKGATGFAAVPLGSAGAPLVIRSLFESGDGRIWIGTRDHGAYVFAPGQQVAEPVHETIPAGLEQQTVQTFAEVVPGVIWLGTDGNGAVEVDMATGRTKRIHHDPSRVTSLPHDYIFSLYRDRSGLLWAGTYSGMGFHDPIQTAVLTVFSGSNQTQGLRGSDLNSVLSTRDGKVWAAFLGGGADILDPSGHRLRSLRPNPTRPQTSLPPDRVRTMVQSEQGDIYLGTYHGLYRATPAGGEVTHISLSPEVADQAVFSLLSDSSGLWIGTRGEGLWRMDYGKTTGGRRFGRNELTNQWISAITPAGDGRLWIGTYQGLYLFDPVSERMERTAPDSGDSRSLSGGLISSLLKDRRGRLWVGTLGGGISLLEQRDADGRLRFHRIGVAEGLPDSTVTALLEDKSGVIWASTANGLAYLDPNSLAVHALQRAEGVGIRSFALNGGTVTKEGEVLFGGDGGLTVIRPDRLKQWSWRPPVVVTDFRGGGHSVPPQEFDEAGKKEAFQVAPEANSLSVEFTALDYSAPERNRYAYRLEGYDDGWVATDSTRRLASYTNLPPGHYTLHLRGSNRDGLWTEATLDIPIWVLPAWYQTIWFRVALAALATAGVWLLVRSRTAYLRNRQRLLEQQVAQRTAELRQSNIQLEARTTELGYSLKQVAESRAKVSSLLDTSGQGFLSFGADLIIEPDCSRACASLLDGPPEGRKADEVLFGQDDGKAELFRTAVSGVLANDDPFKQHLLLSLLPGTIERRGRRLKSEYRLLDNGHVMVVLTDITEEYRLSRKVENERLRLAMIVAAVTESRDFFDAVETFQRFFKQDLAQTLVARASPLSVYQDICRQVHTLKGTLAQFSFYATPMMLDGLEKKLSELTGRADSLNTGEILELVLSVDYHGALEADLTILRDALGDEFLEQGKGIFLPASQAKKLRAFAEQLSSGQSSDFDSAEIREFFAEFRNLDKIALADALAVYDRTVTQVAERLKKEMTPLSIIGGEDLLLDPEVFSPFLRALVHVFRNAVVHGIEYPEERQALGKNPAGRIECVIRREASAFILTVADDGAGIDAKALRERAVFLGMMSEVQVSALSDDQVMTLIFADNITARKQVDELAGRGVGLAALRAETRALGGEVSVTSSAGLGTRFMFSIPFRKPADDAGSMNAGMS